MLTALGCDALQGYAFSRPLSPPDLERFVAKWQSGAHRVQAA
jgi:EAL domain-containing protein (putative c-di-GMP-specific phosphodiesterase class I)